MQTANLCASSAFSAYLTLLKDFVLNLFTFFLLGEDRVGAYKLRMTENVRES